MLLTIEEKEYLFSELETLIFDKLFFEIRKGTSILKAELLTLKLICNHFPNESIAKNKILSVKEKILPFIDDKLLITGEKGKFYPQSVVLHITNICYHNCIHCFRNSNLYGDVMEFSNLFYILKNLSSKIYHITISGGEPLTHPDFKKVLGTIANFKSKSLATSFYGFDKNILNDLHVFDSIQVSVYGWDASSHDNFTNQTGSFIRVWQNITESINKKLNIYVNSMNNKECNLVKVIRLAIEHNVKHIQFGEIQAIGRALNNNELIPYFSNNDSITYNLKNTFKDLINIYYSSGCLSEKKIGHCACGIKNIDIDELGNVYNCLYSCNKAYGNIIKDRNLFDLKPKVNYENEKSNCEAFNNAILLQKKIVNFI